MVKIPIANTGLVVVFPWELMIDALVTIGVNHQSVTHLSFNW